MPEATSNRYPGTRPSSRQVTAIRDEGRHVRTIHGLVLGVLAMLWAPVALAQQVGAEGADGAAVKLAQQGDPDGADGAAVELALPDAEEPDRLRFLFRAGATWADLRGQLTFADIGVVPFEADFGFAVGFGMEFLLADGVSVQPEISIVRRFSQVGVPTRDGRQSKLSTHYLELPVYLKWYPGGREGSRGNLVLGPVPGLLLGATREIRDGNQIQDVEARALLADLDWAIGVGGGFEFSEAFANFTVDMRYVHGLTDMNAPEIATTARWSTVRVVVGIAF